MEVEGHKIRFLTLPLPISHVFILIFLQNQKTITVLLRKQLPRFGFTQRYHQDYGEI